MLLMCLPPAALSTPVSLGLAVRLPTTSHNKMAEFDACHTPSPLDYFAHIRHLHLEPWFVELAYSSSSLVSEPLNSKVAEYLVSKEFDLIVRSYPLLLSSQERTNTPGVLGRYISTIFQHEVPWCLASPILGQLQSLTIHHTFSLRHFVGVTDRLESLEMVRVLFQDIVDGLFSDPDKTVRYDKYETAAWELVGFVQGHARLFPGRLKTVYCFVEDMLQWEEHSYMRDIWMEIYRILPPFERLTVLGKDDWMRLMVHRNSTDLGHVQMVNGFEMPVSWYDTLSNGLPILQRCRALRTIKCELFPDSHRPFRWAAQEKRALEELESLAMIGGGVSGKRFLPESSQGLSRELVQLEDVHITNFDPLRCDNIDDIVFAFSRTLKQLTICVLEQHDISLPDSLHLGQGWVSLPLLTRLTLKVHLNRLVIDPNLFAQCPNLTDIFIADRTWQYNCRDIIPCSAAKLTDLRSMVLSGWSALTFNPSTLFSTTQLVDLKLSLQQNSSESEDYRGFIPHPNEIHQSYGMLSDPKLPDTHQQTEAEHSAGDAADGSIFLRPQWTWDWHLPHLTCLVLESEIAYLFQFKMLFGCPALETLKLELRSTVRSSHARFISASEFVLLPPTVVSQKNNDDDLSSSSSSSAQSPHGGILCLPTLQSFELNGSWVIGEPLLEQLLMTMFPNLTTFTLQEWYFTTLRCLFSLIKAKVIFPKGSPSRRRKPCPIYPYLTYNKNNNKGSDDEGGEELELNVGMTIPTRIALSKLGWKFIGDPNCRTEDEHMEAAKEFNELGIVISHTIGRGHFARLSLVQPNEGGDIGLFD